MHLLTSHLDIIRQSLQKVHDRGALARHLYYFLRAPEFKTDNMISLVKWYNVYQDIVYNFKEILMTPWG